MIRVLWRTAGRLVILRVIVGAGAEEREAGTLRLLAGEFLMLREGWPGALWIREETL